MGAGIYLCVASNYLSMMVFERHDVNLRAGVYLEFCDMSLHWQYHIALLIMDLNFCSDSSYK